MYGGEEKGVTLA